MPHARLVQEHTNRERQEYRGYVAAVYGRSPPPAVSDSYRVRVRSTLDYLRTCRDRRAAIAKVIAEGSRLLGIGYYVRFTNDPEWLVDMAINRRAGWPDDPGFTRGSCMPVGGKYPKRAEGDGLYGELQKLSWRVNTRVIVRPSEMGHAKSFLMKRIPDRFYRGED